MAIVFNPFTGTLDFTGSGSAGNSFTIMQPDSGTSPTASSSTDTLTFTSSDKTISIVGSSGSKSLTFTEAGLYDAGNSGSTKTIDWTNGPVQKVTMTASCTFTLSNPVAGRVYTIWLLHGSGGFAPTLPATCKGTGGALPTFGTTASYWDIVTFFFDGTNYTVGAILDVH